MTFELPEKIEVATANGSSHSTVKDLIKIFGDTLGIPVTLTTVTSKAQAESIGFNRLLLLGGTDISPEIYGEKNTHSSGVSTYRDEIETTLTKRAMEYDVPMMGICRGHQLLAAMHGGTLYQDFGRQTRTAHGSYHRLTDIAEPLKRFMPSDVVNSLHHQSVKDVPPGFVVAARALDGIIEAIYKPGVLGIQGHPEMLIEDDASWTPLFGWFLIDGLREDV